MMVTGKASVPIDTETCHHLLGTFLSLHLTALGMSQPLLHPNAFPQSSCNSLFSCISGVPATINSFLFLPCLFHFPCFCAVWFHVPGGTFSFSNPRTSFCSRLIPVADSPHSKPLSSSLSHLHDTPVKYYFPIPNNFESHQAEARPLTSLAPGWHRTKCYICV